MPLITPVAGLSELAFAYDVLLCDVWGVVHNGRESFGGACDALTRFAEARGPVILISNAPRPNADVLPQLGALRVPQAAYAALVTSGDATRAELAAREGRPCWVIGPERDAPLFRGLDVPRAGPEEADYVCCTGLEDDETETPEDYRDRLAAAAARGLPFVCANPDRVVVRGDRLIWCAGGLADIYAGLGGEVIMAGKPYAPIYDLALAEAERRLGRPLDRARVLCVGDGVPTDVKGADAQGLDCLFIANGIHRAELSDADGALDPAEAEAFLSRAETRARWLSGDLEW